MTIQYLPTATLILGINNFMAFLVAYRRQILNINYVNVPKTTDDSISAKG